MPERIRYSLALIHKEKRVPGYDHSLLESHHRHFQGKKTKVKPVNQRLLQQQAVLLHLSGKENQGKAC